MNWKAPMELQERRNPMRHMIRRPHTVDFTDSWVINDDLAIGLFKGSYPGLKLASAMAYPIAFIPVAFMGLPIPICKQDDKTQELLDGILEEAAATFQKLFLMRRIVGTAWVWPNWNAKLGKITHELIPNSSVVDIIRDLDTGEIIQIITDEQITIQTGENQQAVIGRKRYFTAQTVTVQYTGDVPAKLASRTSRNPSGIMPIPFAKDVLDGSVRGESVYTRLLSDLKNYHDIDLKWSEDLVKFNVKMIQEVEDVDAWFTRNAQLGDPSELDVASTDFILNKHGEEDTKFESGSAANVAYMQKLQQIFYKLVQGSGLPEMVWGLISTGNHASAEEQMSVLVKSVEDDKSQCTEPAYQYFAACLRLKAGATMQNTVADFEVEWNHMDAVSEDVKSQIFQRFADGINKLTANASVPKETVQKLFLELYPEATESDFTKWNTGLQDAAKFKQFQAASYTDALAAEGQQQ